MKPYTALVLGLLAAGPVGWTLACTAMALGNGFVAALV